MFIFVVNVMYYSVVRSLNDLLGDEGLLRLPSYLPNVFVLDESRRESIQRVVKLLSVGKNVLIEGAPGTGKTALMFMIMKSIAQRTRIGFINEGVQNIGHEHVDEGIVLFYDDITRMNPDALRSIVRGRVRNIIATARSEEISIVRRVVGVDLYERFESIKIPPLSPEKIREMLLKYLDAEAVRIIDKDAIDEVVKKSQGLPVYVWQVIRELRIRKEGLSLDFARSIPRGMLDYVDDILWRLLGGKPERFEVLLTLLCMTDFVRFSVHQDLYNYIYMVAKERRLKRRVTVEDIIVDPIMEDVSRYLAREGATYSFRLPHDSWADVLRGKSNGPMAPEISKMNILYKKDKRLELIGEAARRAWNETISSIEDPLRRESFRKTIALNFGEEMLRSIEIAPKCAALLHRDILKDKIRVCVDKLQRIGFVNIIEEEKIIGVDRSAIIEALEKIAEKSLTNPNVYYRKGLLDDAVNLLRREVDSGIVRSLVDIAKSVNVLVDDLWKKIELTDLEKKYLMKRLRKLIDSPRINELRDILSKLERHSLNSDELNLLGVGYLVLWETTSDDRYFKRATDILERTGIKKAYENLAIAYAKKGAYNKAEYYAKKAGIKI